MRALFAFLCLFNSCLAYDSSDLDSVKIRVASYNVLNPIFESKHGGGNTWNTRLPNLVLTIQASNADIICLQEVGFDNFLDLSRELGQSSGYASYYFAHESKTANVFPGRDGVALFIKPHLLDGLRLFRSEKAARPHHRVDAWADVKIPGKEERIRVATTHLEGDAEEYEFGNIQLKQLIKDVQDKSDDVALVVITGDFNEGESDKERPRMDILTSQGFTTDGNLEETRTTGGRSRHNGHIDWIYFKKLSENLTYHTTDSPPIGDDSASDHKLIYTDFWFN